MHTPIHQSILDLFYSKTGIYFDEKKDIVSNKINNFAKKSGFSDLESFLSALKSSDDVWQGFVNMLTVNETYFFRENKQIELMKTLLQSRTGSVNILSAPCSSGEEMFTVLMMLDEFGLLSKVKKITGIDVNSDVIKKASNGIYPKVSFHRTAPETVERYFDKTGDEHFKIKDDMRRITDFSVMNIFDSAFASLGEFDFVFSRNMLIYFDKESRKKAEERLYNAVKPGGILFLGHADIVQNSFGLKKHVVGGIVYYEKC